jgi:hypothetical protein
MFWEHAILLLHYCRVKIRLAWQWLLSFVRTHTAPPDWTITAAYAFDDEGRFMDVSAVFQPTDQWAQDTEEYTTWPVSKVEIRYTSRLGVKYRMILRPGTPCPFPPDLSGPRGMGFVSAVFLPSSVPDAKPIDVTHRLRKYAGPLKDFHAHAGLTVRASDILPMDDWDFFTERFKKLVVTDMHFKRHVFLLDSNPEICLEHGKSE